MLRFVSPPDFESPADAGTDNLYQVTVGADDGDLTGTADVTVGVANVEEIGEVSMSSLQPQAGRALEASVSDPDGVVGTVSWSWQRSANLNSWSTITGETTAVYTAVAGDVGGCWTPPHPTRHQPADTTHSLTPHAPTPTGPHTPTSPAANPTNPPVDSGLGGVSRWFVLWCVGCMSSVAGCCAAVVRL